MESLTAEAFRLHSLLIAVTHWARNPLLSAHPTSAKSFREGAAEFERDIMHSVARAAHLTTSMGCDPTVVGRTLWETESCPI